MSQGPENAFIASIHRHLPSPETLYRMKNHNEYNGGIADCWYSGKRDLWIEYKFITDVGCWNLSHVRGPDWWGPPA